MYEVLLSTKEYYQLLSRQENSNVSDNYIVTLTVDEYLDLVRK